jgi:hypothetical protein
MNPAIEISLCVLAWLIALNRGRTALLNRAWKNDSTAFLVGAASLFFALTMTFLVTPLSDVINRLTLPNFSRLLAYSSVSVTLYLTTSSSLITFPIPQNLRHQRYLKPYLLATLGLLLVSYLFFVSRTPEWEEQPIPGSAAEMVFKLVMFTHAIVLCTIIAVACYHYINQEKVVVTRYRIVTISLTALCGGAFFFTKTILSLSYLWHPLGTEWIHSLSKLLMVGTAMLWGGSFIHNKVYARALAFLRGIRYWAAFQDLVYLVDQLEHLCPPVGMEMSRPNFWQFVRNSDYHLYRAMVHILDGKTLIADFLDDTIPVNKLRARWDQNSYLEATRLNAILRGIKADDDYPEMISAYRSAGRKLMQAHV